MKMRWRYSVLCRWALANVATTSGIAFCNVPTRTGKGRLVVFEQRGSRPLDLTRLSTSQSKRRGPAPRFSSSRGLIDAQVFGAVLLLQTMVMTRMESTTPSDTATGILNMSISIILLPMNTKITASP